MRRLPLLIAFIASFLALCGYYLGNRILKGFPDFSYPAAVWTGVTGFLALVLVGPMLSRILPESMSGRFFPLRWFINMMMAIFFTLLFYTFTIDMTILVLGFVLPSDVLAPLQNWSLALIGGLVVGTFIVGSLQALSPKIYRVVVPIENLPAEFVGFKIAQISDLHIGEMIGRVFVERVVSRTNALQADVIALTGDIIDGNPSLTAPVTQELARLRAASGVFYVTGNHEYYWGVHHALQQIHQAGIKILMNQNVRITRGPAEIAIAGVPDISVNGARTPGQRSDPAASVADVPKGVTKVLLAHQPVSYRDAVKAGIDLQLSGHTHGGQFFPWSIVVRLFQHYNKGLIRHESLWIYVNRGTATWGPRLRFGIPPEITLLTLHKASQA